MNHVAAMTPPAWHRHLLPVVQFMALVMPVGLIIGNGFSDPLLSTIGILFLLHSAVIKDWSWMHHRWVQVAFVLWGYILLHSIVKLVIGVMDAGVFDLAVPAVENAKESAVRSLIWIRYPIGAAAIAFWVLRDPGVREKVFGVLVFTVAFLVLDSMLQYITGYDVLGKPALDLPFSGHRLTGPYTNPKIGIILTWIGFPVLPALIMTAQGKPHTFWRLALGSLLIVGYVTTILLSGERMAVLLSFFGLGVTCLVLPIAKRILIMIILASLLTLGGLVTLKPDLMERHVNSTVEILKDFPDSIYGQIWRSGLQVGAQNPVFGVGTRYFRHVCPDAAYGDASPEVVAVRCNIHPHNYYIEWFSENGLIGLGLFVALGVLLLREAVRGWRVCRTDPVYLGLIVMAIVRLWPIASTTSFYSNWAVTPFWFLMGFLIALVLDKRAAQS